MKYIKGFDGLRALSITLVLLTHLDLYAWLPDTDFIYTRLWLVISGTTGVNIFFCLSGFLITKILSAEKVRKKSISFKKFYAKRFIRLLPPLIIFYLTTGILIQQGYLTCSWISYLLSIFYLYNFVPNQYYVTELGHTWSLAVEEQFYLLWPVVIQFFTRRKVLISSLLVAALCTIARVVLSNMALPFGNGPLSSNFHPDRWFIPAIAPIMLGATFAILSMNVNYNKRLSGKGTLYLVAGLFLTPLYVPVCVLQFTPIMESLAIALLLSWMLLNQQSVFCSILEYKPMAYIGKISYGIYVYQGLFLRTGPGGALTIQHFPLNIILTLAVAVLSYELIEKRALTLKSKLR